MTVEQLAHARDVRRPDPAAALEPHARGAARRGDVSATSFSFEPLFLALAAAAAALYWRAARADRPRDLARRRLRLRASS